jgi:hypothetical protein
MRLDELDIAIQNGASAIAAFYCSFAGDLSLDDAVYEYLEWFELAKRVRRLHWKQISTVLHAAGAGRENGGPFTDGHLRKVVSRQKKRAKREGRPSRAVDGQWMISSVKPPLVGNKRLDVSKNMPHSKAA